MSHLRIGLRSFLQAFGLHDRTAKSAEKEAAPAERSERVCKKRSLLCPLSKRRRRHPRLFAVLDFLVLLGQAKSTKEKRSQTSVCKSLRRYGAARAEASARKGTFCTPPSQSLTRKFSCSFFRRKSQRRPRGENDRETNSVSLKRAPVAGLRHIRAVSTVAARQSPRAASALACGTSLQANRPRFFTLAAVRFCFRHFHIAESSRPPACQEIQCRQQKSAVLSAARVEASASGGPPQGRALRSLRPATAPLFPQKGEPTKRRGEKRREAGEEKADGGLPFPQRIPTFAETIGASDRPTPQNAGIGSVGTPVRISTTQKKSFRSRVGRPAET